MQLYEVSIRAPSAEPTIIRLIEAPNRAAAERFVVRGCVTTTLCDAKRAVELHKLGVEIESADGKGGE